MPFRNSLCKARNNMRKNIIRYDKFVPTCRYYKKNGRKMFKTSSFVFCRRNRNEKRNKS